MSDLRGLAETLMCLAFTAGYRYGTPNEGDQVSESDLYLAWAAYSVDQKQADEAAVGLPALLDQRDAQAARIEELEKENARLGNFADAISAHWPDGDIDGGDLQDILEQHGLIKRVEGGYRRELHEAMDDTGAAQEGDPFFVRTREALGDRNDG